MRHSLLPQRNAVVVVLIVGVLIGALLALGNALQGGNWGESAGEGGESGSGDASGDYPPFTEALPVGADDYGRAAAVALRHARSYGDFAPGRSAEAYRAHIRDAAALADVPGGVALVPADSAYGRLTDQGVATRGRAEVTGIEYLGARSIELGVAITAVAEDDPSSALDLDRHSLLLVEEEGAWAVASTGRPRGGGTAPPADG
ncbi:hypothetical protein [Streptomonospora litoralis]|uniref:Uncharacterized protein n=1 Tax=Streptomonospora litoralis TaxID=2498135 RepID=A0A4P6QA48_9ACTN|nr:hypothetical protein [Streptomonospora litoralis]QBI56349.1 hypothetical protein EKD16_22980 [Streptomonospora litoralis]